MFTLPKMLFYNFINKYVRFIDFTSLSITCKAADALYKNYMKNHQYALSCGPVKFKIYQLIQNIFTKRKISKLETKQLKTRAAAKLKKRISRLRKNIVKINIMHISLPNVVDLILTGHRIFYIRLLQFSHEDCKLLIKYNRHSQIVKYAGFYGIEFKARNEIEKFAFAAGQMKAGMMPKYMNTSILNYAIRKGYLNVIKTFKKRVCIQSYSYARFCNHANVRKYLLGDIYVVNTGRVDATTFWNYFLKKKNFDFMIDFQDEIPLHVLSLVHVLNYVEYIKNTYPTASIDGYDHIIYYCALNAIIKGKKNILELCYKLSSKATKYAESDVSLN